MSAKDKSQTACINIQPGIRRNLSSSDVLQPLTPKPRPQVLAAAVSRNDADASPYQELLQSLYDGAMITDLEGNITNVNARAMDFLLYTFVELRGLRVIQLISGADESLLQAIRQNLENQRFTYIEAYCMRKDGSIFPSEIAVNRLQHSKEGELCFFIRDVTRRKEVEDELYKSKEELEQINRRLRENQAQLVQSEKMAAIGQIAAGVAHEINNPVAFVMSNLRTMSKYVETFKKLLAQYEALGTAVRGGNSDAQREALARAETLAAEGDLAYILKDVDHLLTESIDGTERVREIVQSLKSFARLDEADVKEANINDGIEATLKIIWNELKYKCQVHKKLGQLPLIRCYPGQLNQVFMNVLMNAAQAIADQGEITIETEATDSHIVIRVSDTGCGIASQHISELFTPFFTTKPVGHGTGLGLSISYGIVKKHNGTIEVQSEPGRGSTFKICLPIEGVRAE